MFDESSDDARCVYEHAEQPDDGAAAEGERGSGLDRDPNGDDDCARAFREELFFHESDLDAGVTEDDAVSLLRIVARKVRTTEGALAAEVITIFRDASKSGRTRRDGDRQGFAAIFAFLRDKFPEAEDVSAQLYADALLAWDGWVRCRDRREPRALGVAMRPKHRSPNGHRRIDTRESHGDRWLPLAQVAADYGISERTLKDQCTKGKLACGKRKSFRGPPAWWINVTASTLPPRCRNAEGRGEHDRPVSPEDQPSTAKSETADGTRKDRSATRMRERRRVLWDAAGECWMTLAEVAQRTGAAESTLRDACARGEYPARQRPGRRGVEWWINLSACADACDDDDAMHVRIAGMDPSAGTPSS